MERGRRQYAEDSAVPVSSMIDIVFLLIIFFVVTIDIDREVAENLTINLRRSGNITIDGNIISREQLQALLSSVAEKWGTRHSIVIRGDREVTFRETDKIIKILAGKGFTDVSFHAELKK